MTSVTSFCPDCPIMHCRGFCERNIIRNVHYDVKNKPVNFLRIICSKIHVLSFENDTKLSSPSLCSSFFWNHMFYGIKLKIISEDLFSSSIVFYLRDYIFSTHLFYVWLTAWSSGNFKELYLGNHEEASWNFETEEKFSGWD